MKVKKTCFVISPIGEKNSEVRTQADAFYDLIVEPSLELFDFEVTRADKNTTVSSITSEVVRLVQESDLCIIDISGHNPNVMYECGRRHETGKPYIMMAKEGEVLPFDISSIRTLFYNIDDPREIRQTIKSVQGAIEKMLERGLEPERSGESLSSVSDILARIERKLDRLSLPSRAPLAEGRAVDVHRCKEVLESLGEFDAFRYALGRKDVELIDYLLPLLASVVASEYDIYVLPLAARAGSELAVKLMEERLPLLESFERQVQRDYIGSCVTRFIRTGRSSEALELLDSFFQEIISVDAPSVNMTKEEKAYFVNQYQKLLFSLGRVDEVLEYLNMVLRLAPEDLTYMYNYMLVCHESGRSEEAYKMAIRLYRAMDNVGRYDHEHLKTIIDIFYENKDDSLKSAFEKMQEINKYKAELLLADDGLKSLVL